MTPTKLFTTSFNVLASTIVIMNFISFFERNYNTLNPNFLSEFLCFIPLLILAMTITIKRLTKDCSYGYILLILTCALDPTWSFADNYGSMAIGVAFGLTYAFCNDREFWKAHLIKRWA
jgi:hypothetical protein